MPYPARMPTRLCTLLLVAATALTASSLHAQSGSPVGDPPGEGTRRLSSVAGAAAIVDRIWSPRLADGVASRAVAFGGGSLWITGRKAAPAAGDPTCLAFQVDPVNGAVAGQFALPPACADPTGLAWSRDGELWVATGAAVVRVDSRAGLAAGQCVEFGCTTLRLASPARADFLAVADGTLWIGDAAARQLRAYPLQMLRDRIDAAGTLAAGDAGRTIALPADSRGASFGAGGALWIVTADANASTLRKLDGPDGREAGRWSLPPAVGDLDLSGARPLLWLVSAAGATGAGADYFPLVFSIDPARLP